MQPSTLFGPCGTCGESLPGASRGYRCKCVRDRLTDAEFKAMLETMRRANVQEYRIEAMRATRNHTA